MDDIEAQYEKLNVEFWEGFYQKWAEHPDPWSMDVAKIWEDFWANHGLKKIGEFQTANTGISDV